MTTATAELKQLKKDVAALKREVTVVRETLAARGIQLKTNGKARRASARPLTAVEIARQAGLLGDPTPADKARAAVWESRPLEERRRLLEELRSLKLDPLLSHVIIESRR